ncbi:sodium-coupled monocarboxylate transporter 1-like isoform X2 [Paramacrobiotus metropolitanus]|uniref:sodium-coupled monocarboxylate transporter 1-like isoform X2 n=1 Tax=Paramacrobiotus metropolitanus TaxID=2943436 RepID=UPI002445E5DC|nr:sodium-coupled monocarboxylate transporter 1-like isoform X2 [Paramacrobiotus metropolitanus]
MARTPITSWDEIPTFHWADYLVLALMLAASGAIGIYYACTGGKQKTAGEFLLGDRKMQTFPVAMSLLASFLSSVTLLGIPAEVYMNGAGYWYIALSFCFVIPMVVWIYMPIFYNLGYVSAFEYLEKRFSRPLRVYAFVLFCVNMMVYLAVVLYGPAIALSAVTRIPTWVCILIVGSICTFYTAMGGVKAVVWTDTMQLVLMFGGSITALAVAVHYAGGITNVALVAKESGRLYDLYNFSPDPKQRHTVWSVVIGGIFFWTSVYGVNQTQIQRYLSIPTLRQAQNCLWIGLPGFVVMLTTTTWTGLALYVYYQNCDPLWQGLISAPDQILPMFALETLGHLPGVTGLFVVGVFSGSLSTISSGVSSLAANFLEDCCRLMRPNMTAHTQAVISKIAAVSFGLVSIACAFIVEQLGQVLEFAYALFGMISGPLLGVFALGMFFPWSNKNGALAGFTTGLVLTIWIGLGAKITGPMHVQPVRGRINDTVACPAVRPYPAIIDPYENKYGPFGCSVVIVTGLIVSFLTGRSHGKHMDPRLMYPLFYKFAFFLPRKYREKLLFGVPYSDLDGDSMGNKERNGHAMGSCVTITTGVDIINSRSGAKLDDLSQYQTSAL